MARRGKKPEPGNRRFGFRIRWPYVILLLLMVLFTIKFVQKTQELQQLNRDAAALRIANTQTMRDNARLQRSLHFYKSTQYVEEQARAVLGLTKPGEVSIMSQPHQAPVPMVRRAPLRYVAPEPTWKQWWHSFGL